MLVADVVAGLLLILFEQYYMNFAVCIFTRIQYFGVWFGLLVGCHWGVNPLRNASALCDYRLVVKRC